MEYVSRSSDPGIRNPQVRRRHGTAELLRAPREGNVRRQNPLSDGSLLNAAKQALVRSPNLSRADAAARHGMQRPQRLRRGLLLPESGHRKRSLVLKLV